MHELETWLQSLVDDTNEPIWRSSVDAPMSIVVPWFSKFHIFLVGFNVRSQVQSLTSRRLEHIFVTPLLGDTITDHHSPIRLRWAKRYQTPDLESRVEQWLDEVAGELHLPLSDQRIYGRNIGEAAVTTPLSFYRPWATYPTFDQMSLKPRGDVVRMTDHGPFVLDISIMVQRFVMTNRFIEMGRQRNVVT